MLGCTASYSDACKAGEGLVSVEPAVAPVEQRAAAVHAPHPSHTTGGVPRLIGLDLLRLLAVVLVMGRHMPAPPATWPKGPAWPLLAWQRGGWVGVDLFFVLSGFLVSGLLFTEFRSRGTLSIGRFYVRRGWKIYPPFFALLGVTVIVRLLSGRPIGGEPLASELLFLQSYLPGLWNHTWSLAVEEHFYLLLPAVLLLIQRCNRTSKTPLWPIVGVAVGVAIGSFVLRWVHWCSYPYYSHMKHLFASHLRLDSLFCGVAIGYLYHFHTREFVARLQPWRRWLIGGGLLLLLPPFFWELEKTPWLCTSGLTVFWLGSGMLMVGVLLSAPPRGALETAMAKLGAYSYSIYLWHMPVCIWGLAFVESELGPACGFGTLAAVYLLGSLAVGVLMARMLELPMLRLRDRWFPSRSRGALPA
jgi:peptidoglycan/LPS O-acetylase OafA/YrhL